jgi:hypothetical protein
VSGADTASNISVAVNATVGGQNISLTGGSGQSVQTGTASPNNSVYVGAQLMQSSTLDFGLGSVVQGGNGGVILQNPTTGYPVSVTKDTFSYQSQGAQLVQYGSGTVDGVTAFWGIYEGGTSTGNNNGSVAGPVDLHHFVFAPSGLTQPSVISSIYGTVIYDQVVGGTSPTAKDASQIGGTLQSLKVGLSLGANPGVILYAVTVDDALNRVWTGGYGGFTPLDQFAGGGIPLAVVCTGTGCGSGTGTGKAVGVLIGNTASGLLTSYGLSTTTGQGLVGTAVMYNSSQQVISPDSSGYVVAQTVTDVTGQVHLLLGSGVSTQGAYVATSPATGLPLLVTDPSQNVLVDLHSSKLLQSGSTKVDGVPVEWGVYAGGNSTTTDFPGTLPIDLHHFMYAPGGVTPPSVIASMSGTATYSNILGGTTPADENGQLGGAVQSASVTVSLGATPGVTGYSISLTDAQARSWQGSYQGFTSLEDFGNGKVALTPSCTGNNCGSGPGTGKAGGLLIGTQAGGLATSYGLKMPTGQGVYGTVLLGKH